MNLFDIEKELTEYFYTVLPAGYSQSDVKAPSGRFDKKNAKSYLEARIGTPVVIDRDATNCFKQWQGFYSVIVRVPKNEGNKRALDAAYHIQSELERLDFTNFSTVDGEIDIFGENDDYYTVTVNITYQYGSYTGV